MFRMGEDLGGGAVKTKPAQNTCFLILGVPFQFLFSYSICWLGSYQTKIELFIVVTT